MLIKLIVELVIGGLCGCAANHLMKGDSSSVIKNVLLGIGGGAVGGLLGNLLGVGDGWITGILLSIGGACLIVWLFRKLFR